MQGDHIRYIIDSRNSVDGDREVHKWFILQ